MNDHERQPLYEFYDVDVRTNKENTGNLPAFLEQFEIEELKNTKVKNKSFNVRPQRRGGRLILWQFLLFLLCHPSFRDIIYWIDQRRGEFRIKDSAKLAHLWGEVTSNRRMNYRNMSRGIRYYYRYNIMEPVAKKKLVYRFGPNSDGWQQ